MIVLYNNLKMILKVSVSQHKLLLLQFYHRLVMQLCIVHSLHWIIYKSLYIILVMPKDLQIILLHVGAYLRRLESPAVRNDVVMRSCLLEKIQSKMRCSCTSKRIDGSMFTLW